MTNTNDAISSRDEEQEPEILIRMDDEDADRIETILVDGGVKSGVISRE